MNALSIRPAMIDDAVTIAELHVAARRESYAGLLPKALLDGLSVERRAAWWRGLLDGTAPSDNAAFVAVDGKGQTVGEGSCGKQRDAGLDAAGFDGEFETIYLLNSAKRQGIGILVNFRKAAASTSRRSAYAPKRSR